MAGKFECEVRFFIGNVEEFERVLGRIGARQILSYEFIDYYYRPKGLRWDPLVQTLRIRKHLAPRKKSEILLTKVELIEQDGLAFKRSIYPQGKLRLFQGSFEECKGLLEDLGFEEWLKIEKRDGRVMELPNGLRFAYEFVDGLGWTGELEFEGIDVRRVSQLLRRFAQLLEIREGDMTFKPLASIYPEGLK
jgi:adenylate cyclase class IV